MSKESKLIDKTKWIFQKYDDDCGIAALAMLFRVDYDSMRNLVLLQNRVHNEPFEGTTCQYAKAIGHFLCSPVCVQRPHEQSRPRLAKYLQGRPAVLVVPARGYPPGTEYHAVYWDGKHLFDPGPTRRFGQNGKAAMNQMVEVWYPIPDSWNLTSRRKRP